MFETTNQKKKGAHATLWPWLLVITGHIYRVIHSVHGVLYVLIAGKLLNQQKHVIYMQETWRYH